MARKKITKSAAAKRASTAEWLRNKPEIGEDFASSQENEQDTNLGGITQEYSDAHGSREMDGNVGMGLATELSAAVTTASVPDVLLAWRSLSQIQRGELVREFTSAEKRQLREALSAAEEAEYESLLFGDGATASFRRVNDWLKEHVGVGKGMEDIEKEVLVRALQHYRDKYNAVFVTEYRGAMVKCILTLGSQSSSKYPKRFRVQSKGSVQKVIAQRNTLPSLQLSKEA